MADVETLKEKIDKVALEVAVLAAQQTEMSKRLTEQAASIVILNESHTQTQVKLAQILGGQNNNIHRINSLEESIKNSFKTWATIIGVGISLMMFIINYLL